MSQAVATQQPAASPSNDEIDQRRLDEATFRAERLAWQRMEEVRQRAAVEQKRWREAKELQTLEAAKVAPGDVGDAGDVGDVSEEEDSENEAGEEEFQDAEDQEEEAAEQEEDQEEEEEEEEAERRGLAVASPSSASSSAESGESSGGAGSMSSCSSHRQRVGPCGKMAPAPAAGALPTGPGSALGQPQASAEQQRAPEAWDEDSDGPPPGNWNAGEVPARAAAPAAFAAPFPPLPPSQAAVAQALPPMPIPEAVPVAGVPNVLRQEKMLAPGLMPGSVMIHLIGAKRQKIVQDASVTLKELMHGCPALTGGRRRQLCIADCVSEDTLQESRNCPLVDRPILHLSMD